MPEHQLYLNLGDNFWMTARCACGAWQHERQLRLNDRVSEVVAELEQEFEQHADIRGSGPPAQPLPLD